MPSIGKKQPKLSPNSTFSDRSPKPRAPSTPSRDSESKDEEALVKRLLSAASAKYPALISEDAFCGKISEVEFQRSKGNDARVWLSEAAMVSNSLVPGSLVSVSLAASGNKPLDSFPLDTLVEECARHFGIDVGDNMFKELGSYFAIATVYPSRKVLKNGVKLSWGLSCTMGFPATDRAVFVCPLRSLSLYNCKDLNLNLVPPKAGQLNCGNGLLTRSTSTESDSVLIGNGKAASPKTPSYQSKISSPGATPLHSRKSHNSISNLDSSTCLDVSAARLAMADEKVNELLQTYASRWLYGRYLLNGNLITVPVWGQICLFQVESADKLPTGCYSQDLTCEGKHDLLSQQIQISNSLNQVEAALFVDAKTKVHLSDPKSSVGGSPSKTDLSAGDLTHSTIKESSDIPRLGGLSKEIAALKEIIMLSLTKKNHLRRYKGVLLHGPPGTGKTSLASFCAHDAGATLFSINGSEIVRQYFGESEQALHEVFDSARRAAPAVVFIDELDAIAPARKDDGEELSLRMVATLLKLKDEIDRDDGLLVIAATNRPDSIDPSLKRRLYREIKIGVPSPEQRLDILHTLLSEMDHSLSHTEIQSLALATHGFVGADLDALCNEARMTALRRYINFQRLRKYFKNPSSNLDEFDSDMQASDSYREGQGSSVDHIDSLSSSLSELTVSSRPPGLRRSLGTSQCELSSHPGDEVEKLLRVTAEDFEKAKTEVRPSAMREVMLKLPKVCWEDVGGQKKIKQQLIEAVQWPQICPDAFKRIGISPPRGLLMIGPPGCSKTLMARAVASEAKLNFFAVKGPELLTKWVGESEKAVRSLFAKARENSPAIIFFDEIDGLAVARGQETDGVSVTDRVLSQLLVEMDGLDQRAGVTVIAATNRPDKIDDALLRPGRFDRLLDVQPPDESDREDIFRIHMRNIPCSPDVSIKDLARLTEGYTGADIKLICREAAVAAVEESFETSEVSMEHFKIGIGRVKPSDVQFHQELAVQFRRLVDSGSK